MSMLRLLLVAVGKGARDKAKEARVPCFPINPDLAKLLVDVPEEAKAIAMQTSNRFSVMRGTRTAHLMNALLDWRLLQEKRILEIGPGQYAFAILARWLGARVVCVDSNATIAQFGRAIGFEVFEMDLSRVDVESLGERFDGLWMKGAFNPTGCSDHDRLRSVAGRLNGLIADDGWGMIAPNGRQDAPQKYPGVAANVLAQRDAFVGLGWRALPISAEARDRCALKAKYYGSVPHLFVKGEAAAGLERVD
jgi:hypothetical protein